MKRITIIKNGSSSLGKVIVLPESLIGLEKVCKECLDIDASFYFNSRGAQITDISLLRDDDVIYVSETANFIHPQVMQSNIPNDTIRKHGEFQDWITLNVGGKYFTTSKHTLRSDPDSMLAHMFQEKCPGNYLYMPSDEDQSGAYLIDRNPTYFEPILNYLRNGKLIYDSNINPQGLLEEARFFSIQSLIPQLEVIIQEQLKSLDERPLARRDVVDALIRCPLSSELRFQGVNLAGADLSKLDLRNINFKYANMRGCKLSGANLSWCCLERADVSHTELDGAQMVGVKCVCGNFEGASMTNCNFEDPGGNRANMEGANFKGANLEGSQMSGVNLRVATLKNANLKNCDLRFAVLAGADLENCNLSGSDLHEANLRGANLKDAAFELMLTPLHMSQTIR